MSEYQEIKTCDNCGSSLYKILHHFPAGFYDHQKYLTSSWDGGTNCSLTIVKCKTCGLIYQNPVFKSEYLGLLYPEEQIPETISYEKILKFKDFSFLINNFIKKFSPPDLDPVTIDIGARYGTLTEVLKQQNYNSYGVEFNAKCVEVAGKAGIKNIYQGTIDSLSSICRELGIKRVNAFTLVDVIEHLLTPSKDIEKLSKYQEAGDKIFMVTMNTASLGYKLFGKYWYYIHGQHTYYYTPETLNQLMRKNNYVPKEVFKIKWYKNLFMLFPEMKKLLKHLINKNWPDNKNNQKEWFAEYRPSLLDLMIIVYEKKE